MDGLIDWCRKAVDFGFSDCAILREDCCGEGEMCRKEREEGRKEERSQGAVMLEDGTSFGNVVRAVAGGYDAEADNDFGAGDEDGKEKQDDDDPG